MSKVKLEHETFLISKHDDLVLVKNQPQRGNIVKAEGSAGYHNADARDFHANTTILQQLGNIVHISGSTKQDYTWDDGDYTEEQIDEAISLFKSEANNPNLSTPVPFTLTKDFANNKLTLELKNAETRVYTDWSNGHQRKWKFNLPYTRLEIMDDNMSYLCYNVTSDNPNAWSYNENNIAPGETLTIAKRGKKYNIVLFSLDAIQVQDDKTEKTLTAWNSYNIDSNEIVVKNTGSDNIIVMMLDK